MEGNNAQDLIINTEVIAAIIGALLAFLFGLLAMWLTQKWADRKGKAEITYSKEIIVPLQFAKAELKDRLKIFYNWTEVNELYSSRVSIINTGNRTIRNQYLTVKFAQDSRSVDPQFPQYSTVPEREVGPVTIESFPNAPNEHRVLIETLGPGHIVYLDFLTIGNNSDELGVIFRPNDGQEVSYKTGSVSASVGLESHLTRVISSVFAFVIAYLIGSMIGAVLFFRYPSILGTAFGVPFLLYAMRSIPGLITELAKAMEHHPTPSSVTVSLAESATATIVSGNFSGGSISTGERSAQNPPELNQVPAESS